MQSELIGILEFIQHCEALKNTHRSAYTSEGKPESVAEHTWRLCLMAMTLEPLFDKVNMLKLLKLCIIHDLGEIIGGDIPAPVQAKEGPKIDQEREDFLTLIQPLPESIQTEFKDLWEDYNQGNTPEAELAKALDKLETIMQHVQGKNPDDFNYAFNLEYGKKWTDALPLTSQIRAMLDTETSRRANSNDANEAETGGYNR